jgi:hypothetical protein
VLTAVGIFALWGAVAATARVITVLIIILFTRVVPVVVFRLISGGVLPVCCLQDAHMP